MEESKTTSGLRSLELEPAQVEALSESDLCALIGFLDYDARLRAESNEYDELTRRELPPPRFPSNRLCAPGGPSPTQE
ncbi:MAG TPA: hypothetical protein VHC19_22440 [Pirellulales bacterium]|nr:hypothetical protein [Pirellulales bacterium]